MKIGAGQIAVVTGAASGIGLALARAFGARGLAVVLADVEEIPLALALEELTASGIRSTALRCDVAEPASLDHLRDHALSVFGRIDVLCNNAGVVVPFGPIWETAREEWEWILDVNLRGVFNGIRAFAPLMVAQGSGHIVNTASMAGVSVIAGNGAYNATKHAVVSLTETLQADFEKAGVAVGATAICCGLVRTRIREAGRNKPGGAAPPIAGRAFDNALDPADVARITIDAVEQGRLYAFTNPGSAAMVEPRLMRLRADLASI